MRETPHDHPEAEAERSPSEGVWIASCPRCGYSQRGAIAAWQDACPLEGCCAECGLTFAWTDVLRPNFREPQWCFEYARPGALVPLPRIGPTIARSTWPWWFWRSIKMSHPIRPRRLVAYALILVTGFVLTAAVGKAALAVVVRHTVAAELAEQEAEDALRLPRRIREFERLLEDQVDKEDRKSQNLQWTIDMFTAAVNAPPGTVNLSYAEAVREAVLTPWSDVTRGSVTTGWGMDRYPAPSELHTYLMLNSLKRGRSGTAARLGVPRRTVLGLAAGVGLVVLMPVSFVLLPVSRHKAKVRWGHIVRVFVYSLLIPVVLGSAAVLLIDTAAMAVEAGAAIAPAMTSLRYAPALLVVLWWAAAIRNYLRIPHAWTLAALLSLLDLLVLFGVLWLVAPDVVVAIFSRMMS